MGRANYVECLDKVRSRGRHLSPAKIITARTSNSRLCRCVSNADWRERWPTSANPTGVCTENLIRVDEVRESPKLAE
jgi:hypothetical protein